MSFRALFRKYSDAQPRAPAGSAEGGEWVATGTSGTKITPFGAFTTESVPAGTRLAPKALADQGAQISARWAKLAGKTHSNEEDAAAYYFGHRLQYQPVDVQHEAHALVARVYEATGQDDVAAMTVLGSMESWHTSPLSAKYEWAGAQALGANLQLPDKTMKLPELTPAMVAGFKARKAATEDYFQRTHGDEETVYRGIRGAQATKLRRDLMPASLSEHLTRGAAGTDTTAQLGVRGLSSWSDSQYNATLFATNYGKAKNPGMLFEIKVKPTDVWLVTGYGPRSPLKFSEDKGEVVVWSSTATRHTKVVMR